jgi:hypothetical protein
VHALACDANSSASSAERDQLLGEPTRFEDAPLAIVEQGERQGERIAAVVELVARGKDSLLAGSLVNQSVQPFQSARQSSDRLRAAPTSENNHFRGRGRLRRTTAPFGHDGAMNGPMFSLLNRDGLRQISPQTYLTSLRQCGLGIARE